LEELAVDAMALPTDEPRVAGTGLGLAAPFGRGLPALTGLAGFAALVFATTLVVFATGALLDFVALRAGAFSAVERLTRGFGRADLPDDAPFFAAAARRGAVRAGDLFTPLVTESLMRSLYFQRRPITGAVKIALKVAHLPA
jgi:hypothetical protein